MSNFAVSFTEMNMFAGKLKATSASIKTALQDMERTVEASAADWTGSAKQAYQVAKAEWNRLANQMPVQVDQAQATVTRINETYLNTEQRNTQLWQR